MATDFQLAIKEIKGESQDKRAPGSIDVEEWMIGVHSPIESFGGQLSGRRAYSLLTFAKKTDLATPALWQCLAQNVLLTEIKLVGRKVSATGQANKIDYLTVTLKKARVVSITTKLIANGGHVPVDEVGMAYQQIEIAYTEQGEDSAKRGTAFFSDDFGATESGI